jgi:hypothetical protein
VKKPLAANHGISLHGARCLASHRASSTRLAALGTPGQAWPPLDRCGRVLPTWEARAPVVSAVGWFVWRDSCRPRCPNPARSDIGQDQAYSGGSRRIRADPYNLRVSRWSTHGHQTSAARWSERGLRAGSRRPTLDSSSSAPVARASDSSSSARGARGGPLQLGPVARARRTAPARPRGPRQDGSHRRRVQLGPVARARRK